jgi:hypothetical protein
MARRGDGIYLRGQPPGPLPRMKRRMGRATWIPCRLLLAACSPHGQIQTLVVPRERAAQLTIIRTGPLQGSGNTWVIAVDGLDILGIRYGEHATVTIPSGDRIVTSDCVTAFPLVRPGAPLRVPVQAGGHHYVTLGACDLAEVTETTAAGPMDKTKRPPPTTK